MNYLTHLRVCVLCILFLVFTGISGQLKAEEKADIKKPETQVKEEPEPTLIDLFAWSGIIPKALIDLQTRLDALQDVEAIDKELPKLTKGVVDLQWSVSLFKTSTTDLQITQVDIAELELAKLKHHLSRFNEPVMRVITELSEMHQAWKSKQQVLADFEKKADKSISYVIEERKDLSNDINTALQLIEKQLNPTLALGKKVAALKVDLYAIDSNISSIKAEIRKTSTQQTSPSMLSKEFYTRINMGLIKVSFARISGFTAMQLTNLKGNYTIILFIGLALVLLYWGINWTGRVTPTTSAWYPFATSPMATTTFLVSAYSVLFITVLTKIDVPKEWEQLLHILTVFSVIGLLKPLLVIDWRKKFLTRLSSFLALSMLLVLIGQSPMIIFVYVFCVSIVASIGYLLQFRTKKIPEQGVSKWIQRTWGVFPLLIVLSGLTGYDQFSILFFTVCLATVNSFLIVWVFYRLNTGLLELILSTLPHPIVSKNQSVIMKSLQPLISLIHILLLFSVLGVLWTIWPDPSDVLASIFSIGFHLGDVHISPGFIMTIGMVFYTAMMLSKVAQAILLNEVLPRYDADTGVQLSITRLVHYAILTMSFFVMLRVLGFKLEQITLLGGALGVGIGFGLQAIVNNFASGLILLFERPIKVGDTIQIGPEFGEVKKLGLRATIIQTFDNAEIVVPNSDLVTGQVVNWTLANRKVRVRLPVGVAYGSDVAKVMDILKACAEANPMVLNTPKPVAFFLAFGASSLDFELRVWIPDYLEKTQVISELNQDIESEFALNNIEIPFPQTDLHLRSIDEKAVAKLRGKPDEVSIKSDH
jgi:potassium efflux system protein